MTTQDETHLFVELPSLRDWGDGAWRTKAACANSDTDKFFPARGGVDAFMIVARAQLCCATCTVRKECLEFALTNKLKYGIWGGVTPRNRRGLEVEDAEKASAMSATVILKNLRKVKVDDPMKKLSLMLNLDLADTRALIAKEKAHTGHL
jgi:hypothetical protein